MDKFISEILGRRDRVFCATDVTAAALGAAKNRQGGVVVINFVKISLTQTLPIPFLLSVPVRITE